MKQRKCIWRPVSPSPLQAWASENPFLALSPSKDTAPDFASASQDLTIFCSDIVIQDISCSRQAPVLHVTNASHDVVDRPDSTPLVTSAVLHSTQERGDVIEVFVTATDPTVCDQPLLVPDEALSASMPDDSMNADVTSEQCIFCDRFLGFRKYSSYWATCFVALCCFRLS